MQDGGSHTSILHPPSSIPHPPHLAHQFDDADQQRESSTLGMWTFLATEVMFLGALIGAYAIYRLSYPLEFGAAASHLNVPLATLNTAVLLTSSYTMVLAVHAAQTGSRRGLIFFLILTMIFGAAFLGIKGFEYYRDYEENLVPLKGFQFAFEGAEASFELANLQADRRLGQVETACRRREAAVLDHFEQSAQLIEVEAAHPK